MKTNTTTAQPAGWTDAEVNAWIGDNVYPLVLIAVVALTVRLVIR